MKADFCVDYLSHEWHSSDTIQAYREIQNQISKVSFDTITKQHTFKDLKKITNERNQLMRYQNAIWRQMTKTCTKHLGTHNDKIDPSTVNWQKESDITWLYGPLYLPLSLCYTDDDIYNTTSTLPSPTCTRSECIRVLFKLSHSKRYWSKCVSESGKQTQRLSVRFDPDVTKLEYLPESPVNESIPCLDDEDEEDDEDKEDEAFLMAIVYIGQYIKQLILTTLFGSQKEQENKVIISPERRELTKFCISIASFAAWLIYQTIVLFSTTINRTFGVSHQIKASC
ncbi:hypothetical protein K501DRAFT_283912 [Backusella circina FSU 941]|nr:hypothetical protein K501DRAFT_283912 [Backusella circina FSU 941]